MLVIQLTCTFYSAIPGVYLTLNGSYIPNHGYVMISDIGSTNDTALVCNTNHPVTLPSQNSGGNWFAPNGARVGGMHETIANVPGFDSDICPMMVRLYRNTATGTPSEGIYYCVVEDDTFTYQTVYVGLYNSGGGGIYAYICQILYITTQPSIQEKS